MDERLKESISALMDDESNELELQRILSHDDKEGVQAVWAGYHEVRRVIKQDHESHLSIDISAGVAAAIREEASVADEVPLADNVQSLHKGQSSEQTSKIDTLGSSALANDEVKETKDSKSVSRAWLALAASVAFAFGFTLKGVDTKPDVGLSTIATNIQEDDTLVKVAVTEEPNIIVEMTDEQARHFGQYLLRHAEHSVRGTQSGFMPLARVASVNSVGI